MTETSTPEPKKTKKLAAKAALADVEIGTGDPVNLLNIKSDIQANATTSVDEVKRGGELHFALSYKIDDNKIKEAKAASAWTYDISSLLSSHGGIFKSLTQDVVGEIYDGTNYAGTYEVVNGIVYLKIDPRYWATGKESNVGGTFNLYCKLDSEAIKTDEEKEISFPGSGDFIDITFEDVVTSADKKVNGKTGNAGIVKLNQDGTIKYTLSFYVNADLDSLSVTDILGPGQTIKDGKVTIKDSKGKTKTIVVSPDGDGRFTVDFGAQFNRELLANGTYSLEYNVTVDNDGWNTALTNQASWNWNGANNTPPNNTTITPQKDIASKKVVKGATITNPDGTKKTVFTYTLMVGDGKLDLRGYHIKDIMSKNQTLTSNITMTGGGSSQTLTPLNTPSGNNLILFDYTFPTDGNPLYGPYTITYTTENIGADLSGKQDIKNELDTTPPGSNVTEKDNTSEGVDYGTPGKEPTPTLDKKFESLDGENKEISWVLTVNVPAGKSFTNIKVHEDEYTYTNAQGQKRSMALDWTKTSVTDADGNRLDASYYTIDAANNNVIFAVLDKTVKIKVVTKFDGDKNTYFKNHAQLFDDNVHLDDGQDEYRIAYDFPISKNVSYDSGAKQYVWKITINQDKKIMCRILPFILRIFFRREWNM